MAARQKQLAAEDQTRQGNADLHEKLAYYQEKLRAYEGLETDI